MGASEQDLGLVVIAPVGITREMFRSRPQMEYEKRSDKSPLPARIRQDAESGIITDAVPCHVILVLLEVRYERRGESRREDGPKHWAVVPVASGRRREREGGRGRLQRGERVSNSANER